VLLESYSEPRFHYEKNRKPARLRGEEYTPLEGRYLRVSGVAASVAGLYGLVGLKILRTFISGLRGGSDAPVIENQERMTVKMDEGGGAVLSFTT